MQEFERHDARDREGSPPLPLVRLALIVPFIEALDHRGADTDGILTRNGLARETVNDPDVFVPVIVVHRFLESAAQMAADPHLAVGVGESLDMAAWPPLMDAARHSASLMEFLLRLIRAVKGEASSARHALEVGPDFAVYKEVRSSPQEMAPAQNDGFMAAFTLTLLRRVAGSVWDPRQVWLRVCDPRAIPDGYLGIQVVGGDRQGMAIRFPSAWLLQPLDPRAMLSAIAASKGVAPTPTEFVDSLRRIIAPHLDKPELGLDFVAHLSGVSRQTLQRRLKANGTTFSEEIATLRMDRARQALVGSSRPIWEIAQSVGFADPTSFTRAFKARIGQSPREYRKHPGDR